MICKAVATHKGFMMSNVLVEGLNHPSIKGRKPIMKEKALMIDNIGNSKGSNLLCGFYSAQC